MFSIHKCYLCYVISYASLSVSVSVSAICTVKYRYPIISAFYNIGGTP